MKSLVLTLPISHLFIVVATVKKVQLELQETLMSDHILQPFRLILTAAESYVRQACSFMHQIYISLFSLKVTYK